jgi:hypothetical protein
MPQIFGSRHDFCVYITAREDDVRAFGSWREKWKEEIGYFSRNYGCGCCFNFHYITSSRQARVQVPDEWVNKDIDFQSLVFSSGSERELIKESLKKTQHRLERESLQRILDRL